jgi:hypothetical protein
VADRTFGPSGWGFVLAAQTAGMFAGALVLLRFRPRRPLFVAVGSYAMIPIGQLAAGPLAALAGVPAGVFASAMVITAAITASLFVPSVRRLERTDITPAAR